jgi:hypothetical protein
MGPPDRAQEESPATPWELVNPMVTVRVLFATSRGAPGLGG